jgi:hypothetical protein
VLVSPEWTCTECSVAARFADPERSDPPAGWTRQPDGWRCLACAREAAVEAALRAAEEDDSLRSEAAVRREALARFELERDATRPDASIAKAIGTTRNRVASIRRELLAEGSISPRPTGPRPSKKARPEPKQTPQVATADRRKVAAKRFAELWSRIDAALLAGAERTDKSIAAELDCSTWTVARRRRALETEGAIPTVKRKGFASRRRSV